MSKPTDEEQFASIELFIRGVARKAASHKRWLGRHLDDIYQDLCIQAMSCIRKYRPEDGNRLISYVGASIKLHLKTLVAKYSNESGMYIPTERLRLMRKTLRDPKSPDYAEAKKKTRKAASLDKVVGSELATNDSQMLWATLPDKSATDPTKLADDLLWKVIELLTPRQRICFLEYHVGGKTLDEVGAILRLSRQRVEQINKATSKQLRRLYETYQASESNFNRAV